MPTRTGDAKDRTPSVVRRANRIIRATPEIVRRTATSRPGITALRAAHNAARSTGDSAWGGLEVLVYFLETLDRLDRPNRDDSVLLDRLELLKDNQIPVEIVRDCKHTSITDVVCNMLRETPAGGGGLTAAVLVVQAGNLHERISRDEKPKSSLFPATMRGLPDITEEDDADLFGEASEPEPDATRMPLFEDREVSRSQRFMTPAYVIQIYDIGGGKETSNGPGAPIEQRIFLDFWRLPASDRDGYTRDFARRVEELIDCVWPYGYDWKKGEWPRVVEAFDSITRFKLSYTTDEGSVRAFRPETFRDWPVWAPRNKLGSQLITGTLTLPEGAAIGPSMSREVLQHAGTLSGLALRLAIAWTFYRGKYFFQNGHLTKPTIPRTRQNRDGHYLDRDGNVIVDKRGVPVKSFKDDRVVFLDNSDHSVGRPREAGRVPNEFAIRKAPALSLDEWRHACYARLAQGDHRHQLARDQRLAIVKAVDLLADSGIFRSEWTADDKPIEPGACKYTWLRPDEEANLLARKHTKLRLVPAGPWGKLPDKSECRRWRDRYLAGKRELREQKKRHSETASVGYLFA